MTAPRLRLAYLKNWKFQMRRGVLISIVDDDEPTRESTKGLVRSLGYQAATFASAEEFLQSDSLDSTACLITDVQMPGLSGIDLQRGLIAQGILMPTIFITAFPEEETRARAMKAGAVGYLSKPCREESLLKCLDRALGNSGEKASPT
jgi:FixJ family two-component response regulator